MLDLDELIPLLIKLANDIDDDIHKILKQYLDNEKEYACTQEISNCISKRIDKICD